MKLPLARRSQAAFTLIEMVVSAALMTLILVSAYLCLSSGLASQKLVEARGETLQSARVALSLLTADLRSACPLSKDTPFLGLHRMIGELTADNLDFATHHYVPQRAGEGDYCETSYYVAREPESGLLSLWRRRNPMMALNPLSGGAREEIARGVRGLQFEYSDGIDWYDSWGDPSGRKKDQNTSKDHPNWYGMPEAVRVTLWLEAARASSRGRSVENSEDKNAAGQPLVLSAVARLNLASTTQPGTTVATPATTATDQSGPSTQPNPGGNP